MVVPPALKGYLATFRKTDAIAERNALLLTRMIYESIARHWHIVLEAGKSSVSDNLSNNKLVVPLVSMVGHDDLGAIAEIVPADISKCACTSHKQSVFI